MSEPPKKRQKYPNFRIELRGDENKKELLQNKIQKAQIGLQKISDKNLTKYDILDAAVDSLLEKLGTNKNDNANRFPTSFIQISKEKSKSERIFVTTESAINKSLDISKHHAKFCSGYLKIKKKTKRGHAICCRLTCNKGHSYQWSSSPYIEETGSYLVNQRILYAYFTSGMLPSQYVRFTEACDIGTISWNRRQSFIDVFRDSVQEEYDKEIQKARLIEIGLSSEDSEEQRPIDILTDARHGCRKNAKDTSVVAIGDRSHKVIACEHVTKKDCLVSQKHELIGSKRIAASFERDNITIGIWAHDFNPSINKFVRELPEPTENQNETWHGVKNVKKELTKVSKGPRYKEGKTWHRQLQDKVDPIATHFQYCMRNCGGDPQKLRDSINGIILHYQNNHEKCDEKSRCRTDLNYEPSRIVVTDTKAELLLKCAVENSIIYRNPQYFCKAKDTFYVESFNNTILMFADKRISFSDDEYLVRSQLAVLHWNQNVDRGYTSVTMQRNSRKAHKNLKKRCYDYRDKIWKTYIANL